MPPSKKAQQWEDVRMKVSMFTHTQSHKYSNNNCTTSLNTIHGTPALLVHITIKQQRSTSGTVQGSGTVEWRLQYHSSTGVTTVASKVLQSLTAP